MRIKSINYICLITLFIFQKPVKSQSTFNKIYSQNAIVCQTVVCDNFGGIYIGGTQVGNMFVTKLDSNGTVIWSKTFGEPYRREILRDMIVIPGNNHIVIAGTSDAGTFGQFDQSILIFLDTSGAQLSVKYIGDTLSSTIARSLFLETNNFLLVCMKANSTNNITNVIKFDFNGNPVFEKSIQAHFDVIQLKYNDKYYLTTQYQSGFIVTDTTFANPVSTYSFSLFCTGLSSVIINYDSLLIGVGGPQGPFIEKFDSISQPLSCHEVQCSSQFFNIFRDGYGGYYILGSGWEMEIIHLDGNFNVLNSVMSNRRVKAREDGIPVRGTISPWGKIIFTMAMEDLNGFSGFINVVSLDTTLALPCGVSDSIIIFDDLDAGFQTVLNNDTLTTLVNSGSLSINSLSVNNLNCTDTTTIDILETKGFPLQVRRYTNYYEVEAYQRIDNIDLLNINGVPLYKISAANQVVKIETDYLSAGIYLLRIYSNNKITYFKILKI